MNSFRLLSLLLLILASGCSQSTPSTEESTTSNNIDDRQILRARQLISVYDSPQGTLLTQIEAGEKIVLAGAFSDKLYTHFTASDTLCLPYLQIQLGKHNSGWVLANAQHYENLDENWQLRQCMRSILNDIDYNNYLHLIDTWKDTEQAPLLLLAFETEHQLIRTLEEALASYPFLNASTFDQLLPATITYNDHESLRWWVDYNQWVKRGRLTDEAYDEALFQFYQKKVFPPDGISYGFPAWSFPVSATQEHSLLGRGIYLSYLQELKLLRKQHPSIDHKWNEWSEKLLLDLLEPSRSFWEEFDVIEEELKAIIELDLSLIQHTYKAPLQDLLQRLEHQEIERIGHRSR